LLHREEEEEEEEEKEGEGWWREVGRISTVVSLCDAIMKQPKREVEDI